MSTRQFKTLIDELVQLAKAKEQIEVLKEKSENGKEAFDSALVGVRIQEEMKVDELEGLFVPRDLFDKLYGKVEEELLTSKDPAVRDIAVAIHEDREAGKQREIERRKKKERLTSRERERHEAMKSSWANQADAMSAPEDDTVDLQYMKTMILEDSRKAFLRKKSFEALTSETAIEEIISESP